MKIRKLKLSVIHTPSTGMHPNSKHACSTDEFAFDRWTNEGGALANRGQFATLVRYDAASHGSKTKYGSKVRHIVV